MPPAPESREYRYYDFVMAAYVCILLCSNLIGPAKETSIQVPLFGTVTFLAGVLFFPISYIFGLAESLNRRATAQLVAALPLFAT